MRRGVFVMVMAAFCWSTTGASAQPEDHAKAKELFAKGKKLYAKRKYALAVEVFKEATKYWKHRVIHYNIALAYTMLGDNVKAVTHLRIFLKTATAQERRLPSVLRKAQQKVGVVVIKVRDPKAKIYVEGRMVGRGRVELVLLPGKRAVDVRLNDRVVGSKEILVQAGKEQTWELQVVKEPRPSGPGVKGPPKPESSPPTVKKRGLGRLHWGYFVAAAAVALGGAAAATFTSVRTMQLRDQFLEDRANASLRDRGVTYRTTSFILWGAAGGVAVAAAVLAVFTRWRKSEESARVSATPAVWSKGAGVSVTLHH